MHHPGKSFHNYWTSCSGPQYFFPWFCVPNLTLRTPQSWCDWAQRTPSDGWDSQVTHSIRWWLHFSYGSITSESWRYLCFVCFFFLFTSLRLCSKTTSVCFVFRSCSSHWHIDNRSWKRCTQFPSQPFSPENHWVSLLLLLFCHWHVWCCL